MDVTGFKTDVANYVGNKTLPSTISPNDVATLFNEIADLAKLNVETEVSARMSAIAGLSTIYAALVHTHTISDIVGLNPDAANGFPTLDSNAKIKTSQLPDSIVGNVAFKGSYNGSVITSSVTALNGQPLPAPSSANVGWYFICSAAFTNSIGAITKSYDIGDWIISEGATGWDKIDNTDAVMSVAGRTGAVVLTTGDVAENAANLYFTGARVLSQVLTGYGSTTGTISTATTLIQAIGILNGNLAAEIARATAAENLKLNITNPLFLGLLSGPLANFNNIQFGGSALAGWGSSYYVTGTLTAGIAIQSTAPNNMYIFQNMYNDGTNWRYNVTGAATLLKIDNTGVVTFYIQGGSAGAVATLISYFTVDSVTSGGIVKSNKKTIFGLNAFSGSMGMTQALIYNTSSTPAVSDPLIPFAGFSQLVSLCTVQQTQQLPNKTGTIAFTDDCFRAMQIATYNTGVSNLTNTVTRTSLIPISADIFNKQTSIAAGTDVSIPVPGNAVYPHRFIEISIGGVYTVPASTNTFLFEVTFNGSVIASGTINAFLSGGTNLEFDGLIKIAVTNGSSVGYAGYVSGSLNYSTGNNAARNSLMLNNNTGFNVSGSSSLGTGSPILLNVFGTWNIASTTRSFVVNQFNVKYSL